MHWKRLPHLVDVRRWSRCRELFREPWRAFVGLSFVNRGAVPVTLKDGRTLPFSRAGRDHKFWDWFLRSPVPLEFTDDGLLRFRYAETTLLLRPGTTDFAIFEEIFLNDDYGVRTSPRRYGTVVDLGANVGLFSCAVLKRTQRVIAVEAVAENHAQAVRNIAANGGIAADVLHAAVASRSGDEVRIFHNPRNTGGHSVSPEWTRQADDAAKAESVRTISLKDLLHDRRVSTVDLLKCDIEGAEYDVFAGADASVLSRIREIAMEVHVSPAHPPRLLKELAARLRGHGFAVELEREIPETERIDSFLLTATRKAAAARAA
jgi:FkbM family methyltransferase